MKTFIGSIVILLTLPVLSQTDGDDIVIGKFRRFHSFVTNEERILNYEKSLQLNPGNENTKKMLEKLK